MSIKACFFAKFDTQEGPKIIHQLPSDAIYVSQVSTELSSTDSSPLFNFSDISFFVIPRQELCDNLITVCKDGYRIVGYPVCVSSSRYDRNEFIFNFCLVLAEDEEFNPFKAVVQKLANLMRGLEEQSGFLSRDTSRQGEGKIYSLCEMLMEDLNNYAECMIPIDELNTLNIKLFPTYAPPPRVKAWYVPIFTVRPETLTDDNWDLTMQRIMPHINGISSVKQIAILADADIKLTKKCIKHLLYYGCLLLLDVFSFSAIYAPTARFSSTIAADVEMQRECAAYVNTTFAPTSNSSNLSADTALNSSSPSSSLRDPTASTNGSPGQLDSFPLTATGNMVDGVAIVELYASLSQGLSVKQWYLDHSSALANIDLRRFITFGIIKGFLYRVHKYAFLSGSTSNSVPVITTNGDSTPLTSLPMKRDPSTRAHALSMNSTMIPNVNTSFSSSGITHAPEDDVQTPIGRDDSSDEVEITDQDILPYLDGTHCFDQICTELEVSEAWLTRRLKNWGLRNGTGEVNIIHR